MPHKRNKKRAKSEKRSKAAERLVQSPLPEYQSLPGIQGTGGYENQVSRLSETEIVEIKSIIQSRFSTARDITEKLAEKMINWDKQYNGVWNDKKIESSRIFLPKTREQVQAIYSYIMLLVSQLNPIVTFQPHVSSLVAADDEFRRAKVAEALVNYYLQDLWKFKDDLLPRWLKCFLKYTLAIWKVTYVENEFVPDLKIDVVDRALLYVDPTAHDIRNATWVIEKFFLNTSDVLERVEQGWWKLDPELVTTYKGAGDTKDDMFKRYFGDHYQKRFSIQEDELIECYEYWQAPVKGVGSAYGVLVGGITGELACYGENPMPYKGLPYRAKAFDPDEWALDGTSVVEQYRPFQEVLNTFINYRVTDVRKNIIRPVAATGRFIDAQTQQDFADGHKIVRLSEEVLEASKDPSFDLRKHFVELPFGTSTSELLQQDLPMLLGLGKESSNVSDVLRGMAPPHQATLGQIQEQLSRNQGVFRPVYMQVMRSIEELAEIIFVYLKDPILFPVERIIQIVGKNQYADVVKGWHNVQGTDTNIRSVTPDEMDIDVTINAVSGADAMASRTLLMSSLESIFQSIGQIPELYKELSGELNFSRIVEMMLHATGQDTDALKLNPQQKQQKAQQQAQAQQSAQQTQMQMAQLQIQLEAMKEQAIQKAKAEAQIAVDSNKNQGQLKLQERQAFLENENMLDQISHKVSEQLRADLIRMLKEAQLEMFNNISVGHGNNLNESQGFSNKQ